MRDPERPGYASFKRRPRIGLFILVLSTLLVLGLGAYLSESIFDETSGEPPGQVDTPAAEQEETEDAAGQEQAAAEEETTGAVAVPDDPTHYLTVPRLGLYRHTVRNDRSEETLGLGAIKLPDTGFLWEKGATTTYIACHRLGFPATESFH